MDDEAPIERRAPFSGVPSYDEAIRRPSIEGRDSLAYAASQLKPYQVPVKKRRLRWPRWLTWKRTVALLAVDVIFGPILWHHVFAANPGAVKGAVNHTLDDLEHHNWSGVYDSLCRNDRAQVDESDLAAAGDGALEQLGGGLARWTITSVTNIHQNLGPMNLPAAQVSGQLYPLAGSPSPFTVVVVHEIPEGWHICMSAGGFSMLGYTEPLGSGFSD
ncbi:MAG TPA: hypothetical protein VHC43_03870 [Mycobacteriales bacterium]|nr:hypothetical protein [Mycobacteriales bacterium]